MSRARPSRVSTVVERESELALVERLRRGDPDAFDDVYIAFNTRLFTFLVRLSRRRDAADICGITPEALRQRLHRARETLSKMLERDAAAPALGGVTSCPSR